MVVEGKCFYPYKRMVNIRVSQCDTSPEPIIVTIKMRTLNNLVGIGSPVVKYYMSVRLAIK